MHDIREVVVYVLWYDLLNPFHGSTPCENLPGMPKVKFWRCHYVFPSRKISDKILKTPCLDTTLTITVEPPTLYLIQFDNDPNFVSLLKIVEKVKYGLLIL